MKKFKNIIFVLLIILLTSGCTLIKDQQYYKEIANKVITLFKNVNYDDKGLTSEEKIAMDRVVSEITHEDQLINVSDFIVKKDEFKVSEGNSKEIHVEDGICYTYYDKLDIESYKTENEHYELEPHKRLVCDGYYTVLYESDFYPSLEDTKNNPLHNYAYVKGYKTDVGYNFIYRSTYNGSYLTVSFDLEDDMYIGLSHDDVDLDNLNIDEGKDSSELLAIMVVIVLVIIIALLIPLLLKKKKESEF